MWAVIRVIMSHPVQARSYMTALEILFITHNLEQAQDILSDLEERTSPEESHYIVAVPGTSSYCPRCVRPCPCCSAAVKVLP